MDNLVILILLLIWAALSTYVCLCEVWRFWHRKTVTGPPSPFYAHRFWAAVILSAVLLYCLLTRYQFVTYGLVVVRGDRITGTVEKVIRPQ